MIKTFDDYISLSAVQKAETKFASATPKVFFAAAKAHDVDAINLLFYKGRSVIAQAFYKYFLGPDKKFWRARILKGDDREFAGEVYAMLLGSGLKTNPIDTFDYTKFSTQTLPFAINKFNYYLLRYCEALAHIMNKAEKKEGLGGNIPQDTPPQFVSKDVETSDGKASSGDSLSDFGVSDSSYAKTEFSMEIKQFLSYIKSKHPDLFTVAILGAKGNSPKEIASKLDISPYHVQKKQLALKDVYMKNFAEKFEGKGNAMKEQKYDHEAGNYKPLRSFEPEEIKKSKKFDMKVGDVLLLDPNAFHTYDPKGERYAVVVDIKKDDAIEVEDETGGRFIILDPKKVAKIKESEEKEKNSFVDEFIKKDKTLSYLAKASGKQIEESLEDDEDDFEGDYAIGDRVRINPAYSEDPNGDIGVITGFSPSKSFVIIDVDGQGEGSYHLSDIEGKSLEDDWNDDEDDYEFTNDLNSRPKDVGLEAGGYASGTTMGESKKMKESIPEGHGEAWLDELAAFIADPSNPSADRLEALRAFDSEQGITDGEYNEEALDYFEDTYRDMNMELGTSDEIDDFNVETPDWMDYEDDMIGIEESLYTNDDNQNIQWNSKEEPKKASKDEIKKKIGYLKAQKGKDHSKAISAYEKELEEDFNMQSKNISPEQAFEFAKGMKKKGQSLKIAMKSMMTQFHGGDNSSVIDAVKRAYK